MLDKTIPYIGVIMIKEDPTEYPRFHLPDGYEFCMYKDGYENHWADLKLAVGEFDTKAEAVEYFQTEFMKDKEELPRRCMFIRSTNGDFVATSSLWYGNHFGNELRERIHWVSVHPDHQGKGLAKALITKTLDVYAEVGSSDTIYLTTQTWSYKAINIYLSFGFKPYIGPKPTNWVCKSNNFDEENKEAWNLIFEKIYSYRNKQ